MLEVLEPGPFTTLQEAGRFRLSHLGISAGGAADPVSWEIGNRLVGNLGGEASLEMTLRGGTFRFSRDAVFALTGADPDALLEGKPVAAWESVFARAGETLKVGALHGGARAYLAIDGGVLGPRWGEKIRQGDSLALRETPAVLKRQRSSYRILVPPLLELRFVQGVDWDLFPQALRAAFGEMTFALSPDCNRNGLRLKGILPSGTDLGERVSEGVSWGTIQLPPTGEPMILMNDQQTTGGYPNLAQVIQADFSLLGQLKPGHKVKFSNVEAESAVEALRERRRASQESIEAL